MSTLQEIEAAIPQLSPGELQQLRAWLENFFRERANGQSEKRRSVRHLRPLQGQWVGEPVLKSGDLADEMFARS